jgi:demethylmenaquinone methyltransferase/2-methoxy-6-polyprenyl-1,4-benzoquinol methylase
LAEKANFSNIYKFYDLINSVITLGFDKSWRDKASSHVTGTTVLDLGSGTGAALKQLQNYEVTAVDPDEKMLQLNKFSNKVIGSAEDLPFSDSSFDSVYCAFVWRNVNEPILGLNEIYRVLRPGGKFILLDMTRPKNKLLKFLHKVGTFNITLLIGILTFNLKEYRFLHKSLDKYPEPEIDLLKHPFTNVDITRMGLFGFVYLSVFEK